jgi:GNAT superfamily N-acetyltransferase
LSHQSLLYRLDAVPTARQVADLYRDAGLIRPVDDLPRMQRMLDHANLIVTAWDGDDLVGIARSVTDFSFCCYLSDLAVASAYQRKGIGRELIRRTQETAGEEAMLLLLAAPTARDYYGHIGFEKSERAWMVPRRR